MEVPSIEERLQPTVADEEEALVCDAGSGLDVPGGHPGEQDEERDADGPHVERERVEGLSGVQHLWSHVKHLPATARPPGAWNDLDGLLVGTSLRDLDNHAQVDDDASAALVQRRIQHEILERDVMVREAE